MRLQYLSTNIPKREKCALCGRIDICRLSSLTHSSPYRREPEWPRAEVGFPTADHGFSSIQGTLFGFRGIQIAFDACNIYPHQARTNANDKMAAKDYTFTTTSCTQKKIPRYRPHRNGKGAKRCRISIARYLMCY